MTEMQYAAANGASVVVRKQRTSNRFYFQRSIKEHRPSIKMAVGVKASHIKALNAL